MRRILISAAVAALTVAAAGPARASGPGHNNGGHSSSHGSGYSSYYSGSTSRSHGNSHFDYGKGSYFNTYAKSFSHGYYYPGKFHSHWTYRCWSSKYGCECFYCPYTCCWYYWCEPGSCYYPVSYIREAPPVVAAATASQAVSQSVVVNSPGAVVPPGGLLPPAGPDGGPLPPK